MRGDPERLNAEYAAQAAASRDKFQAERESYRAEAEADDADPDYIHAMQVGERTERRRIATALDALERKAASLFFEGTPSQRAVAQYVAEVRAVVEGKP